MKTDLNQTATTERSTAPEPASTPALQLQQVPVEAPSRESLVEAPRPSAIIGSSTPPSEQQLVVGVSAPPAGSGSGDQLGFEQLAAIPELRPHLAAARTFGFAPQVSIAADSAATWIAPSPDQPLQFPHAWIKAEREARYLMSRQRTRKLLDRLCGVEEPPPKTVVIVAHPDDEAIGAGARLHDIPGAVIIHVTDGAPRDPEYAVRKGFATREAYVTTRQEELRRALSIIGIPGERTHCLGIVDGEATERLVEVTYGVAELLDQIRPEVVLTHPYEGGHTDHDATAFAVHLACGILRRDGVQAPIVLELTSYHYYQGKRRVAEFLPFYGLEERTLELEANTQALKQAMYDTFASQQECLAAFPTDREKFRPAPRYVFEMPPHAGPLLYERLSSMLDGSTWRERARRALYRLRSKRRIGSLVVGG